MAKLTILVIALYFALISAKSYRDQTLEINYINSIQSSWKAGYSKVGSLNEDEFRKLLGTKISSNLHELKRKQVKVLNAIPKTFDARKEWPQCKSISSIKNQGQHCKSGWAVSTASAASDRLCIGSNLKIKKNLSAINLLTCCVECTPHGRCKGGSTFTAWKHIRTMGIVTGGGFGSDEGCQPYSLGPNTLNFKKYYIPECHLRCTNRDYEIPYDEDITRADSLYLLDTAVEQIQTDILRNGPVTASLTIHDDFRYYKSGVYVHTTNKTAVETHDVKIIGWGHDEKSQLDYWLVTNSWGTDWGLNGLFKIKKGTDECEIEEFVTGGLITGDR